MMPKYFSGKRIARVMEMRSVGLRQTTESFLMLFLVLCPGCATRIGELKPVLRSELLATEQGRLSELTDPVSRTKSYITISEVLLSFVSDDLKGGGTPVLNRRLEQYVSAVRNARDTMLKSDRDAQRYPAGFKELEAILRGHLRLLQDLRPWAVAENRNFVENTIKEATSIRNEMLALLVPEKNSEH